MFDREKDPEEFTAKNTKSTKGKTSALRSLRSLWLSALTWVPSRQSEQFWPKSRPCKSLMVNGVKPVSNRVKPISFRSQGCGQAANFAGLVSDKRWHSTWHYLNLGAGYCQIKSDKFTYSHLWSDIGRKIFLQCVVPDASGCGRQLFARNMPGMCFVRRVANSMVRLARTVEAGGGVFVN
jgi:hypothetical protein